MAEKFKDFLNLEQIEKALSDLDADELAAMKERPVGNKNPWESFKNQR